MTHHHGVGPLKMRQAAREAGAAVRIAEELALPPVKIHCSILAEDAIKAAIDDFRKKHAPQGDGAAAAIPAGAKAAA